MPIGTAAPAPEELKEVTHHFILDRSVKDTYSIGQYEHDAIEKLEELFLENDVVLLVGGSMMYEKAVIKGLHDLPEASEENQEKLHEIWQEKGIEGLQNLLKELDPQYYDKVDLSNPRRLLRSIDVSWQTGKPYSSLLEETTHPRAFHTIRIGIEAPREVIYQRINQRVEKMISEGLEKEAKKLLPYRELSSLQTVGYSELFQYFDQNYSLEEAIEEIKKNSRRFAKRQLTWYRKEQDIHWVPYEYALQETLQILATLKGNEWG